MPNYQTLTPLEFKQRIDKGEKLRLIDVREPEELELVSEKSAEPLPLSRLNEWAGTLNPAEEIVFMCHHGVRSAHVCEFFAHQGFSKLYNLTGGIDRWAHEVDPGIGTY